MLVGCAGLSLDTVGVIRAYLCEELEHSEVIGADDLDLDAVLLAVVQVFLEHVLGCFLVRVVLDISLERMTWDYWFQRCRN